MWYVCVCVCNTDDESAQQKCYNPAVLIHTDVHGFFFRRLYSVKRDGDNSLHRKKDTYSAYMYQSVGEGED